MNLTQHLIDFASQQRMAPGDAAYVGFSGGIDSTALLLLMLAAGMTPVAVHFQHGIRGEEAEGDANWCRAFCRKREVECRIVYLDVPRHQKKGEATEEAARRLRMENWERIVAERSLPVFLAHHQDDVMEEMFLRLARGCNVTGLTGLRPRRDIHGVVYLRPLLDCRKDDLKGYLQAHGVDDWRTDSTNLQSEYRRNAVRNQLLPLFKTIFGTDAGLVQALTALRWDADCLEKQAQAQADALVSLESWQAVDQALLSRVFRLWRYRQDGVDAVPSRAFVLALSRALTGYSGVPQWLQLNPYAQVRLDRRGLELVGSQEGTRQKSGKQAACPAATEAFDFVWHWQEQPVFELQEIGRFTAVTGGASLPNGGEVPGECDNRFCEWFCLADMPPCLTLRSWRHGDRMVPFGRASSKKLQDIFTDGHISRERRRHIPLMLAGDAIIWVPGVKRAEYGRMENQAQGVCLTFEPVGT